MSMGLIIVAHKPLEYYKVLFVLMLAPRLPLDPAEQFTLGAGF